MSLLQASGTRDNETCAAVFLLLGCKSLALHSSAAMAVAQCTNVDSIGVIKAKDLSHLRPWSWTNCPNWCNVLHDISMPDSNISAVMFSVQWSSATDIEMAKAIAGNLEAVLDIAGIWRPVNALSDRDRNVAELCRWLCFGRNRAAFDR